MNNYLEEPDIELTPKMKKDIYDVSERKKLSFSKILIIMSAFIIVLIIINIFGGVYESKLEFNSELQGKLYQEKGIGGESDLEINESNKTLQNNSFTNFSD